MRQLFFAILMLSVVAAAEAAQRRVPVPSGLDMGKLEAALRSGGFKVASLGTSDNKAFVILESGEAKDPAPVVESLLDETTKSMRQLARKWQTGTITAAEKDQLLKMFVAKFLEL